MQSTPTASAFWLSKTFWVNLVALLSLLIPAVAEWIKTNPIDFAAVLAAVNVVLKFITHGQSSMVGDDPEPDRQKLSDEKADRLYRELFADAPAKKSDSESESPSTLPAPGSNPSPWSIPQSEAGSNERVLRLG